MASTTTRPTSRKGFALRKLVWVGPLTIIVAVLVNLVIRTIAVAFFGVPDGFTYLQAPFVIGSTVVFLLLALLAFILVGRFARRQVGYCRILTPVPLLVSFPHRIMAPACL